MRRVSSLVSARPAPAGASLPLISTSGGLPGEKKRSLIFGEVLNIAASSVGVVIGATAGVAAVAVPEVELGTAVVGEDMRGAGFLRVIENKRFLRLSHATA